MLGVSKVLFDSPDIIWRRHQEQAATWDSILAQCFIEFLTKNSEYASFLYLSLFSPSSLIQFLASKLFLDSGNEDIFALQDQEDRTSS